MQRRMISAHSGSIGGGASSQSASVCPMELSCRGRGSRARRTSSAGAPGGVGGARIDKADADQPVAYGARASRRQSRRPSHRRSAERRRRNQRRLRRAGAGAPQRRRLRLYGDVCPASAARGNASARASKDADARQSCGQRSFRSAGARAWIEEVTKPVAQEIAADHEREDRQPGEGRHPPLLDHGASCRHHGAPFRRRRHRPEAEEAQAGEGDDRGADIEREEDDERGPACSAPRAAKACASR